VLPRPPEEALRRVVALAQQVEGRQAAKSGDAPVALPAAAPAIVPYPQATRKSHCAAAEALTSMSAEESAKSIGTTWMFIAA
jgi:hypothetical protein